MLYLAIYGYSDESISSMSTFHAHDDVSAQSQARRMMPASAISVRYVARVVAN